MDILTSIHKEPGNQTSPNRFRIVARRNEGDIHLIAVIYQLISHVFSFAHRSDVDEVVYTPGLVSFVAGVGVVDVEERDMIAYQYQYRYQYQ